MLDPEDTTGNTQETAGSAPSEAAAGTTGEVTTTDAAAETPADTTVAKAPAKKAAKKATTKKAAAKKSTTKEVAAPAGAEAPAESTSGEASPDESSSEEAPKPKKKAAAKPKKKAEAPAAETPAADGSDAASDSSGAPEVLFQVPEKTTAKKAPARKRTTKKIAAPAEEKAAETEANEASAADATSQGAADQGADADNSGKGNREPAKKTAKRPAKKAASKSEDASSSDDKDASQGEQSSKSDESEKSDQAGKEDPDDNSTDQSAEGSEDESGEGSARRRPRRRGGRRRRGRGNSEASDNAESGDDSESDDSDSGEDSGEGEGSSRRRRQRQRKPRNPEDEIASVSGSTRLEAKKQRRREGREAGRRRAPIVSEAEFLARRESVERVMVIRQRDDYTQIGVLEDKVLVEHYVARKSQTSLIGNVYLGRVQNVLPSMEAAFIDIGKGRNAVIYAGEVNWAALGHKDGQPRKIESVLSPGQTILVQVTKDPVGHKGARLSGQVSLPGRFLVYVPDGNTSGISRKLPDTERNRLKTLLKQIVPDSAGVIVRTAAEGASEEELTRDVQRLTARWQDIENKIKAGKAPELLYGEPDLTLKVVRDLFTEDFSRLVVQGDDAWDLVHDYVEQVAPDLEERLERYDAEESGKDIFAAFRVDEQIAKGLDRKVWLPSGGSLIIDRTEAMTVVDVNTGKFTGSGGNLEETVTKNNLEAAEEMVRQLRLRDIGGIIVIDFIDMVLESNRDLVLRRLVECLGRDRTRHQVAEVTSLGLVQMTRKRIGTGLVEAFSEDCTHCKGRGVVIHDHPMETDSGVAEDEPRGRRGRGGRSRGGNSGGGNNGNNGGNTGNSGSNAKPAQPAKPPSPADLAGTRPKPADDEAPAEAGEKPGEDAAQAPEPQTTQSARSSRSGRSQRENQKDTQQGAQPDASQDSGRDSSQDQPGDKSEETHKQETPAAPAGQTVVTTTRRRRTATRPAGPPKGATTDPAATGAVTGEAASDSDRASSPENEAAPALAKDAAATVDAAQSAEDTQSTQTSGSTDTTAATNAEDEQTVLHVPVKRKGTRKR